MKKTCTRSLGLLFLTLVLFSSAFFLTSQKSALAGISESVFGWAWSGSESVSDGTINGNETGIGWISLNSVDCDNNGDGFIDVPNCGPIGSPIADYGVQVPFSDGALSGYAWSGLVGWISFNAADLVGCTPLLSPAERIGNDITGGARILSIRDAGSYNLGFDGCINLSNQPNYGVQVTPTGSALVGYAWSSDFGWIDFSGASVAKPSGSLSSPGCSVPAGKNSCVTTLDWTSSNVTGASITEDGTTIESGINGDGSDSITLDFMSKTYRFLDSNGNLLDTRTLSANCVGALLPDDTGNCADVPPSPVVTLTAVPNLIRSGTQATLEVTITADYDLDCFFNDVMQAGNSSTINHANTMTQQSYTRVTRPLSAAQIVRLTCPVPGFETTLPPTVVETRIQVIASYEEV